MQPVFKAIILTTLLELHVPYVYLMQKWMSSSSWSIQDIHCKNKWVEITHAWLPELHTSKDNCNSGNQAWVTSTHLFLQCKSYDAVCSYKRVSNRLQEHILDILIAMK